MSLSSKQDLLIHKAASKYILGENINIDIKGKKEQLVCLNQLLDVSKNLYESLNDNTTSLKEIMSIVENKKQLSDRFEKITGIKWKL
jgi:hypothetical protein